MSITLTLTKRSSMLSHKLNPPISKDEDLNNDYKIVDFDNLNLIPNNNNSNNDLMCGEKK